MKKLLALVLALVMTMGLATVAANASSYPDASDVDLNEAVDVMSAVGVFKGDEKGNFAPKANLDRAAAAKLIAYLDLGEKTAEALPAVKVFADVPETHWAAKYIAYCQNAGIIQGDGTNFYPSSPLTGYAFAAYLFSVLGYDRNYEGLTGSGWQINTAKLLQQVELSKGVDANPSANLTREQAAQYCLNALKSQTVKANKGTTTTVGGVAVTTGASDATPNGSDNTYDYNGSTDGKQQLCEKLYKNKLQYKAAGSDAKDDFGRAAHAWYWDGTAAKNKVGEYANEVEYTYVVTNVSKTGNVLAVLEELGLDTVLNKTTLKGVALVLGDSLEFFTNDDGKVNDYLVFKTQLAQVTKVASAASGADYDYTVTLKTASGTKSYKDTALTGFDASTMTKDTYVTYTSVAGNDGIELAVADKVTGKVTGTGSGYVMIDKVKTSLNGAKDGSNVWKIDTYASDFNNTFDFFVSENGYVIGAKKISDENTIDNIFFVADKNFSAGGTFNSNKAQLKVYYLDGKTEVANMDIDSDDQVNIGGTKYALGSAGAQVDPGFYAYTMSGDKVEKITKIVNDTTVDDTYQDMTANDTVVFASKSPNVQIGGSTFYASGDTKVTMIDKDGKITTITGYSKLPAKTYTIKATSTAAGDALGVLYVADGTKLKEVYILGAYDRVGASDSAVYGYYVKTSEPAYNETDKVLENTLVFNVKGSNTDYLIKNANLASSYEGLYKLEVKDGYVTTTKVADFMKKIDDVGDGYVVIGGSIVKLSDSCEIYDATDAENITSGELNKGDIVSYTTSDSKINRIYVDYAAESDGIFASEKSDAFVAYLMSLGYSQSDADYHAKLEENGITIKYTLSDAVSGDLVVKITAKDTGNNDTTYNFGSVSYAKDAVKAIMIDLKNDYESNHSGNAFPVGDYEITVTVGGTEVASSSFTVGA